MANFVRRIVSGNKARFRDEELNLELDLVYVTDNIIIMGYPASAFEGIYRNRREDAKKFLDHRHKNNYWIFNFCPLQENSYPSSAFGGRVSRYPFPDHHAPPLSILPLATREIRLWLDGSPDRVAVLHCKAGKGRSGTVACAYLLSLDEHPSPPRLERSYTGKEWSEQRADEWIQVVEEEGVLDGVESTEKEDAAAVADRGESEETKGSDTSASSPASASGSSTPTSISRAVAAHANLGESTAASRATLESVLALHTQRRMRAPKKSSEKQKQGVSISSQRRWLHYWSQILSASAPAGFWSLNLTPSQQNTDTSKAIKDRMRITDITIRMKEPTGTKGQVVKVANVILDRASYFSSKKSTKPPKPLPSASEGPIWISLARYDDVFVETLEQWEVHTRHDETPGRRKSGSEHMHSPENGEGVDIKNLFESGSWDTSKMVRRFATFGALPGKDSKGGEVEDSQTGKILKYSLKPLDDSKWTLVKKAIVDHAGEPSRKSRSGTKSESLAASEEFAAGSDEASFVSVGGPSSKTELSDKDEDLGTVVDARREIRAKLYFGKIPMGWFWFIPAFHLSQTASSTTLKLKRKEVDFPLGPGEWLVEVEVGMEWVSPEEVTQAEKDTSGKAEVAKQTSVESDIV